MAQPTDLKTLSEEIDQLIHEGATELARTRLSESWDDLARGEDPDLIMDWVNMAQTLVRSEVGSPLTTNLVADIDAAFHLAIDKARGRKRASIANRQAIWKMQRAPDEAAATMRTNVIDAGFGDVFAFRFNYARALELSDQKLDALSQYWIALEKLPESTLAAEACVDLMVELRPDQYPRAQQLLKSLIDTGNTRLAERALFAFLVQYGERAELLREWIRYYTAVRLGEEEFQRENGRIEQLVRVHPELAPFAEELRRLYSVEYWQTLDPPLLLTPIEAFPHWVETLGDDVGSLSRLLKVVADSYLERARSQDGDAAADQAQALARYSAAYLLDVRYIEGALSAASLMMNHADNLGAAYDRWLDTVFKEKTDLMFTAETRDDYLDLYYMRLVLAKMFAQREQWDFGGMGVVFQLEHALENADTIRSMNDPAFQSAPEVHYDLATAYVNAGNPSKAIEQFLIAAEKSVATDRSETARTSIAQAEIVSGSWTEKQAERLASVKAALLAPRPMLYARVPGFGPVQVLGHHSPEVGRDFFVLQIVGETSFWYRGSREPVSAPFDVANVAIAPDESIAWSSQSGRLAFRDGQQIRIVDPNGTERTPIPLETEGRIAIALSARGDRLAVASDSGRVTVHGVQGEQYGQFELPAALNGQVVFGNGDRWIVATAGQVIGFWNVESQEMLRLEQAAHPILSCAVSAGNPSVAVACEGDQVLIWRADLSSEARILNVGGTTLALGRRGETLAIAGRTNSLQLWDMKDGTKLSEAPAPYLIRSLAFSTDEFWLAVGSREGGSLWKIQASAD